MTRVSQEFSRFASSYNQNNTVQAEVAKKLVSMLPKKAYPSILDLGCGRGEIYQNLIDQKIDYAHLTAVDISKEMLWLHPKEDRVTLLNEDFNSQQMADKLSRKSYDLLLSSSALQWSQDLDTTLSMFAPISSNFYSAIFTAGTFRSLHKCAGITSPIYNETVLKEKIDKYYDVEYETVRYTLHFENIYDMLRYIKESGTSGGERRLSYRETKHLIRSYPYDYLEFEVLFVHPKSENIL
ncbi:MAG: methyltransferase domain-containing protein [Campylobacterota bacterium]|nr:methyltransferase domain-containing protein [Campylobacterota bacterium]